MECVRCGSDIGLKAWNAKFMLCPKDWAIALEFNAGRTATCDCETLKAVCKNFVMRRGGQFCSNCHHDGREHGQYKKGKLQWRPREDPKEYSRKKFQTRR